MQRLLLIPFFLSCFFSCHNQASPEYLAEIEGFRKARIDYLKSEEGYLNLAGLFWLEDGEFGFGSHPDNFIRFPATAPEFIGTFRREGDQLVMSVHDDVEVFVEGERIKTELLLFDGDTIRPQVSMGSFEWFAIGRGDDIGVRLRDYNHPLINKLTHIESFPTDPEYRVAARWIDYETPKVLKMPNQTGQIIDMECVGAFEFTLKGEKYTLEPVGELYEGEYFLMIYDETSGEETYGSGRYMYIAQPDSLNMTVIDFNKAFNPPCVFTEFATCLFPHEANRLPLRIEAGEKYPKSWSFE